MIHVPLEGVARTLLMTLRARADEHQQDNRLFDDEWSYEWYQWMPTYEDLDEWYSPTFQLASAIRTQIIDDITDSFINDHQDAVIVEMGGGLSSRPYRIGLERAQWVILDLPLAMSVRQKVDAQNDNLLFLSQSATDEAWFDRLPETDEKNYLFIAEGVLMFLEKGDIKGLIEQLKTQFKNGTLVFDALRDSYRDRESENFAKLEADIQFSMDESDIKDLSIKEQSIDYLLTVHPKRWQAIGVDKERLTKDNSGFIVTAKL